MTSPLLLLPCELERASPRSPFTLRCADDDLAANATLAAKLRNDFGIELPELDLDDATPGECLDAYRDAFRERRDWKVSSDLHLSIFAYSKLAMWRDLETLKEDPTGHGMVAMLAGVELPGFTQNKDTLPKLPTEKDLEVGPFQSRLCHCERSVAISCRKQVLCREDRTGQRDCHVASLLAMTLERP